MSASSGLRDDAARRAAAGDAGGAVRRRSGGTRRFYGWPIVGLLYCAMAINATLPIYGLGILNVHMADELGFSRATLGAAFATYMLMTGVPGPLAAKLVDTIGIRWTMVLGNLILLLGSLGMASIVRTPAMLILVGGGSIGLANAIGGPIPIQALVTRWFVRRRALAMGLALAGASTTGLVIPPLLEQAVGYGGWRMGWWLIAAAAALITIAIALFVRERPGDVGQCPDGDAPSAAIVASERKPARSRVYQTEEEWHFHLVMRSSAFWLLLACSTGVSAVYTIFHAQAVLHIRDLGYSTTAAAYLLSLSVGIGFVAHMAISLLGDRIEPKAMWAVSLLVQGIGIGLFAYADRPWLLYPAILCLGAGGSSSILCLIMVFSNWFGASAAPFVFGWGSVFSAACGALAPIAAGFCYDAFGTFAPIFLITSVICVIGSAVLWVARPPRLSHPRSEPR